jgi:hypothetical protein
MAAIAKKKGATRADHHQRIVNFLDATAAVASDP